MHVLKSKKSKVLVATAAILALGGTVRLRLLDLDGHRQRRRHDRHEHRPSPLPARGNSRRSAHSGWPHPDGRLHSHQPRHRQSVPDERRRHRCHAPRGPPGYLSAGCWAADYTVGAVTITHGQIAPSGGIVGGTVVVSDEQRGRQPGRRARASPSRCTSSPRRPTPMGVAGKVSRAAVRPPCFPLPSSSPPPRPPTGARPAPVSGRARPARWPHLRGSAFRRTACRACR